MFPVALYGKATQFAVESMELVPTPQRSISVEAMLKWLPFS